MQDASFFKSRFQKVIKMFLIIIPLMIVSYINEFVILEGLGSFNYFNAAMLILILKSVTTNFVFNFLFVDSLFQHKIAGHCTF